MGGARRRLTRLLAHACRLWAASRSCPWCQGCQRGPTASCRSGLLEAASKGAQSTGFVLTQAQGRGRVPVRLLQRREYVRRTLTARMSCERAARSLVARDFYLPLFLSMSAD